MSAPRRRRPRTLAAHLVPRLAAALLLVFSAVAATLLWSARETVDAAISSELDARIHALSLLLEVDVDGLELEADPRAVPDYRDPSASVFYAIVDQRGQVHVASRLAREVLAGSVTARDNALVEALRTVPDDRIVRASDGRRFALRVREVWIPPEPRADDDDDFDAGDLLERLVAPHPLPDDWTRGENVRIAVGVALAERDRRFRQAIASTVPTLVAALLFSTLLAWLTVRWSLRPLRLLEQRVGGIDPARPQPLRVASEVSEVALLGRTLDVLIERIDLVLKRERRFMADVAHELRTPVAELRTLAEVGLRLVPPDGDPDRRAELEEVARTATRLGRMLETLFQLTRQDTGQGAVALEPEPVALAELVDELLARLSSTIAERSLTAERRGDVALESDATMLRTIVENLLDNAAEHAPAGTTLGIELASERDRFELVVCNDAPQLSPDDAAHLFDPFWRKDEARSSGSRHVGLGLALCHSLASVLGLELSASIEGGRLRVALRGPRRLVARNG